MITDKGLVYGDLIRVIKDPSTADNPLPFEQNLVAKADYYNDNHGFKDWEIKIPNTVAELQQNYRKHNSVDLPAPDNPDEDHSPENWTQRTYHDIVLVWNDSGDFLEIDTAKWYHAGEDWANNEHGIEGHQNWYEFTKQFGNTKGRPIRFKRLVIWDTESFGYYYCVPIAWETPDFKVKQLKAKAKTKPLINL